MLVSKVGFNLEGVAKAGDDLRHPRFNLVAHSAVEIAHSAANCRLGGNDIKAVAGIEPGDAEHRRLQRINIARDNRLQRGDGVRGGENAVIGLMRHAGVAARRPDGRRKNIEPRHQRSSLGDKGAERHIGQVMHAIDRFHGKFFEQALLDHAPGAAFIFFSRLKNKIDNAVKIARSGKFGDRRQQHRRMAVMTAGVHFAVIAGFVVKVVGFPQRKRIHIGAQPDGAVAVARLQDADDASTPKTSFHLKAACAQFPRDNIGCAMLFEGQFRVAVQIAPNFDKLFLGFEEGS